MKTHFFYGENDNGIGKTIILVLKQNSDDKADKIADHDATISFTNNIAVCI